MELTVTKEELKKKADDIIKNLAERYEITPERYNAKRNEDGKIIEDGIILEYLIDSEIVQRYRLIDFFFTSIELGLIEETKQKLNEWLQNVKMVLIQVGTDNSDQKQLDLNLFRLSNEKEVLEVLKETLSDTDSNLAEESEISIDISQVKGPRHTLVLLHELGILENLRKDYNYLPINDLARLICIITGQTNHKQIAKEIDAVVNNNPTSGKGGKPVTKDSARAIISKLTAIGVKIKRLKNFED